MTPLPGFRHLLPTILGLSPTTQPFTYARARQDAYIKAMVDDTVLSDRIALGLLPMGAAVLGLGVTGTTGDPIMALALSGATGYGLGTWFTNKARREVFKVGATATGCVIAAAAPLDVSKEKQKRIETARNHLHETLVTLRGKLDPENTISAVTELITNAEETLRHADEVLQGLNQAGSTIVNAVEAVRIEITKAAVDTAQDLRDLQDHLKSSVYAPFQDILGIATPKGKSLSTGELEALSVEKRTAEEEDIREAVQHVQIARDTLAHEVAAVNISGVPAEFGKCLDSARGIQAPTKLRISPSSLVRVPKGGSARIVITGAKTRPAIVPLWPKDVKIQLDIPDTGALIVEITIDKTVPVGAYFLSVRDEENDVEKTVRIEVLRMDQSAAEPTEDKNKNKEARNKILESLNVKMPAAKWKNAESSAWTFALQKSAVQFRLNLKTKDDATTAKSSPYGQKLQTLENIPDKEKGRVTVTIDKASLVLTVSNAQLQNVREEITPWPEGDNN